MSTPTIPSILTPTSPITPLSYLPEPPDAEDAFALLQNLNDRLAAVLDADVRKVAALYKALVARGVKDEDEDGMGACEGKVLKEVVEVVVGVQMENADVDAVISRYDTTGKGLIPIDKFIYGVKGDLPSKRLHLVQDVYKLLLDSTTRGVVSLKDAKAKYNTLAHPRVQSGELDPDRVLSDFVTYWERGRSDGRIELVEWEYYFAGLSAAIDRDEYFDKVMRQCWPGLKEIKQTTKLTDQSKRELASIVRRMDHI
ncbi:hypothetical protein HK104_005351, partial [Borealophlyctis nickersoniae]